METIQSESVSFEARDGFLLRGTYLQGQGAVKHHVQINAATGVKKEFYLKFGSYLAQNGYPTLIYDYRGIGESTAVKLKRFKARMFEYGTLDQNAALNFLESEKGAKQIIFIGHSVGGQFMGVLDRPERIRKVLAVNSSTGYWKSFPFPWNYKALFLWWVLGPLLIRLYGYFPGRMAGLGESLPKGVFRDWRKWCLSKNHFQSYIYGRTGKPYFAHFKRPITFIHASDDYISTDRNVQRLRDFYPEAPAKIVKLHADKFGGSIGHVPIFRSRFEPNIWPIILQEMKDEA